MRPIDADRLKEYKCSICNNRERCEDRETVCSDIAEIDEQPTIEVEPVKHAKWYAPVSYEPCEWCSNCHERTRWFFDDGYCPKCGARMDGD